MMPHPTTMRFAWDEEVLRCARVLISIVVLAVALLFGGAAMMNDARVATTAAVAASPQTDSAVLGQ